MSNRKDPSVPGVVLAAILDIINNLSDDSGVDELALMLPSEEELEGLADALVAELINEVILSTNRQPSVSGVVLDVIMEFIRSEDDEQKLENGGDSVKNQTKQNEKTGIVAKPVRAPTNAVVSTNLKGASKESADVKWVSITAI